jgi:hypothetical protein
VPELAGGLRLREAACHPSIQPSPQQAAATERTGSLPEPTAEHARVWLMEELTRRIQERV